MRRRPPDDQAADRPTAPLPHKPPAGRTLAALAAVTVLVAASGSGFAVARRLHPAAVRTRTVYCSNPPVVGGAQVSTQRLADVAAAVTPSVVSISAEGTSQTDRGSGIILRSDGIVVTNNHVIANVATNGGSITVTFADQRTAPATVVGRSPGYDIAVLRAHDVSGLRPAALGSADNLRVGDEVEVIGDALGLPGTVTAGIVSALNRDVCVTTSPPSGADQQLYGTQPWLPAEVDLKDLIQTDAPINEGNSGGALVDINGAVVGMCTASKSPDNSSGSVGIGFAIRIDVAYNVAEGLLRSAGLLN